MGPLPAAPPSSMQPAATSAAICVARLIEWAQEASDIENAIERFCSEVNDLLATLMSLQPVMADKTFEVAVRKVNNGELLRSNVDKAVGDAKDTVESLRRILESLDSIDPEISALAQRQQVFKRSLTSGEISILRQRIVLLNATLGLPMQMISIKLHERGEGGDSNAAAESKFFAKIRELESAIDGLMWPIPIRLLGQTAGSSSEAVYTNARAIADMAQAFASAAKSESLGCGLLARRDVHISSTMKNGMMAWSGARSAATVGPIFDDDLPREDPREHMGFPTSQTIKDAEEDREALGAESSALSIAIESLSLEESLAVPSSALDFDAKHNQERLGKGLELIRSGQFDDAAQSLCQTLKRIERGRSSKNSTILVNDAKLLLAQARVGQKNDVDAETTLLEILEAVEQDHSLALSAKHALAEIAIRREDFNSAKALALEAVQGKDRLFGQSSATYSESFKLLSWIYAKLGQEDEVERRSALLAANLEGNSATITPISTRMPAVNVADRFIKCHGEICILLQGGKIDLAVSIGIHFLKDHYIPAPPYRCESHKKSWVKWDEIESNIRNSDGRGFLGWTSGMCAAHFLAMADPEAVTEMDYLLSNGLDTAAITILPPPSLKEGQDDDTGCTLLMTAAFAGHASVVRCLLQHGAVASTEDTRTKKTALAYAAAAGDLKSMQLLCSETPSENAMALAMNTSCQRDQMEAVLWLLDHGGDVKGRGWLGAMPIHAAASGGSVRLISMFLSKGCELTEIDDERWNLASYAAYFGKDETLKFLIKEGADVSAEDQDGRTALLSAAEGGNSNTFLTLISHGANVEEVDNHGENALTLASFWGREEFVTMLFTKYPKHCYKWLFCKGGKIPPLHGAVISENATFLRLLLDLALNTPTDVSLGLAPGGSRSAQRSHNFTKVKELILEMDPEGWTPLHIAATIESADCLKILLYQMGPLGPLSLAPDIDVPRGPSKESPLHRAAMDGRLECVKLLLARGASVRATDCNGASAAHWAAWGGNTQLLKLIMDECIREPGSSRLGDCHCPVDNWGTSPLHYAARKGKTDAVRVLVDEYGAHPLEQDKEDETPIHVAALKGHPETLKALLSVFPSMQGYLDVSRQSGHTPLMDAAAKDQPDCVGLLLAHGASPLVEKRPNLLGETKGMTAAHFAAAHSISSLKLILDHTPLQLFDPPRKSTQTTLLATASEMGPVECVTLLLERGATPLRTFPRNGFACSALSAAVVANKGNVVRLLCEAAARERPDDWMEWLSQNLHFDLVILAAGNDKAEALEALMDSGFDMRTARKLAATMDMEAMTPFGIASKEKKEKVLKLLKERGIMS